MDGPGGTAVPASVAELLIMPLQLRRSGAVSSRLESCLGLEPRSARLLVTLACPCPLCLLLARRRHSARKAHRGPGLCTRQCGISVWATAGVSGFGRSAREWGPELRQSRHYRHADKENPKQVVVCKPQHQHYCIVVRVQRCTGRSVRKVGPHAPRTDSPRRQEGIRCLITCEEIV